MNTASRFVLLTAVVSVAFSSMASVSHGVEATPAEEALGFVLLHRTPPEVTQHYLNKDKNVNPAMTDGIHAGIDFRAAKGTTVYSPMSGVVVRRDTSTSKLGMCAIYSKTLNRTLILLHLSRVDVALNTNVSVGQVLGASGDVGAPGQPHLHAEVRPGKWLGKINSATNTIDPTAAFADQSVGGTAEYHDVWLDASNEWYRIFDLELFSPGELTAIVKNSGNLDADLWYSWDGSNWYYLSAHDGNEFVNSTFGSGYGTDHYSIYIAVVAYSGAGYCEFGWHATQSAP